MPPLKRKRAKEKEEEAADEEEEEFHDRPIYKVPEGPMFSILEFSADTDSLKMVLRCVCKWWATLLEPKDKRCVVSSLFPRKRRIAKDYYPVTSLLFDASKRGYSSLCIKAAEWRPGIARFPMVIVGDALCEAAYHGHDETCVTLAGPKVRTRWTLTKKMANAIVRSAGIGGRKEAALLGLKWGGNPDCLLNGAARGGHLEICKLAVAKGGSLQRHTQVVVILSAARSGHTSIIEWLTETLGYRVYSNEQLLRIAGIYGRTDLCHLVKRWEERDYPGVPMSASLASEMMIASACGGQLHICKLARKWGATRAHVAFWNAALHGKEEICLYLIKHGVGEDVSLEPWDTFSETHVLSLLVSLTECPHGFTPSEAIEALKFSQRFLSPL